MNVSSGLNFKDLNFLLNTFFSVKLSSIKLCILIPFKKKDTSRFNFFRS